MIFRTLLFSTLLAAAATIAVAADAPADSQTNAVADTTKNETAPRKASARHDHAAERLGSGASPSASPASEESVKPEIEKKARHDHMRDMK